MALTAANTISKAKAIEVFGTPTLTARACAVTQNTISRWPEQLPLDQTALVILAAIIDKGLPVTGAYFPEIFNPPHTVEGTDSDV